MSHFGVPRKLSNGAGNKDMDSAPSHAEDEIDEPLPRVPFEIIECKSRLRNDRGRPLPQEDTYLQIESRNYFFVMTLTSWRHRVWRQIGRPPTRIISAIPKSTGDEQRDFVQALRRCEPAWWRIESFITNGITARLKRLGNVICAHLKPQGVDKSHPNQQTGLTTPC